MAFTAEKTLIFIVDDDPDIRDSLKRLFTVEHMEAITFSSAEEFLEYFLEIKRSTHQDHNHCAILDLRLPGMDGLELQEALSEKSLELPIVFLSGHGDIPMTVDAMKAGAENFLTKPVSFEKLLACVKAALEKNKEWRARKQQRDAARKRLDKLTSREMEIVAMTVQGLPNKLIAKRLNISLRTVEHHKSSILDKTESTNTIELAKLVQESELNLA